MSKVEKRKQKPKEAKEKGDNKQFNKVHEDYAYDFIPHLNEWLNIDEQKEKVEELEDID